MTPILDGFVRTWPLDSWIVWPLVALALLYLRGWLHLRRRDSERWPTSKLFAFLGGLGAIFVALASPIESFAAFWLHIHMIQHLLLTMAAPPLLWFGAPFFPLLRGLPRGVRNHWVGPMLRCRWLRRAFALVVQPIPAWLLFALTMAVWHLPSVYDAALQSDGLHYLQHVSFLVAALIFWYPVLRPYPSRPTWSLWILIPYLLFADVLNTVLSAILTFAGEPIYSTYAELPRLANLTAVEDQAVAGVIMWVPGSLSFLIPLFIIGVRLLYGEQVKKPKRIALQLVDRRPPQRFDWLRLPVIGSFLRWRHSRMTVQVCFAILAAAIIYDGLFGPPIAGMNLAGVAPWIHWRGLVVVALLLIGNLFCFGCPFLLPRTLVRRWLPQGRAWPIWLRNKWPAIALLAGFLWAYEALSLWDDPWITAWIAVAYFLIPLVLDSVFRGAPFCKFVCPIGQFNFVQSLVSPFEVRTRQVSVCDACHTKDCIRGRDRIPGCELDLFLPRKHGNMDCTLCLDCVHACPHENIEIAARSPGVELWENSSQSQRSGFTRRPDVVVLIALLVFGGFVNAAGMTSPVMACREQVGQFFRAEVTPWIVYGCYAASLILAPLFFTWTTAWLSERMIQPRSERAGAWPNAVRFVSCLVPLGFAMWLAHYGFHFFTSYEGIMPVGARFVSDMGIWVIDSPNWLATCCVATPPWLLRMELLMLGLGYLLSLYVAYQIAESNSPTRWLFLSLPWAGLITTLYALGVWIVLQPMQMRGTLEG